jgi:quercetin dioxygenase-like cupin family protein
MGRQMLSHKQIELGDIKGTMFLFEFAGDLLAEHTHDEETVHITIVTKGRVRAFSSEWSQEAEAGQIIDFKVGQPHAIEALEDGTKIYNINKKYGSTPSVYLPASEGQPS